MAGHPSAGGIGGGSHPRVRGNRWRVAEKPGGMGGGSPKTQGEWVAGRSRGVSGSPRTVDKSPFRAPPRTPDGGNGWRVDSLSARHDTKKQPSQRFYPSILPFILQRFLSLSGAVGEPSTGQSCGRRRATLKRGAVSSDRAPRSWMTRRSLRLRKMVAATRRSVDQGSHQRPHQRTDGMKLGGQTASPCGRRCAPFQHAAERPTVPCQRLSKTAIKKGRQAEGVSFD